MQWSLTFWPRETPEKILQIFKSGSLAGRVTSSNKLHEMIIDFSNRKIINKLLSYVKIYGIGVAHMSPNMLGTNQVFR